MRLLATACAGTSADCGMEEPPGCDRTAEERAVPRGHAPIRSNSAATDFDGEDPQLGDAVRRQRAGGWPERGAVPGAAQRRVWAERHQPRSNVCAGRISTSPSWKCDGQRNADRDNGRDKRRDRAHDGGYDARSLSRRSGMMPS